MSSGSKKGKGSTSLLLGWLSDEELAGFSVFGCLVTLGLVWCAFVCRGSRHGGVDGWMMCMCVCMYVSSGTMRTYAGVRVRGWMQVCVSVTLAAPGTGTRPNGTTHTTTPSLLPSASGAPVITYVRVHLNESQPTAY
jgi:hypothetical protein